MAVLIKQVVKNRTVLRWGQKKLLRRTKKQLNLDPETSFFVSEAVSKNFQKIAEEKNQIEKNWQSQLQNYQKKHPEKHQLLQEPISEKKLLSLIDSDRFKL